MTMTETELLGSVLHRAEIACVALREKYEQELKTEKDNDIRSRLSIQINELTGLINEIDTRRVILYVRYGGEINGSSSNP